MVCDLMTLGDGVDCDSAPIPVVVAAKLTAADSPGTRTCLNPLTALCNLSRRKVSPSKNKTPRSRVRVAVSSHCTGEDKACHWHPSPDPAQSGSSLHWIRPLSLYSSWLPSNVTFGLPGWLLWNSTVTRLSLVLCRDPAWVLSIDAGSNSSVTSKVIKTIYCRPWFFIYNIKKWHDLLSDHNNTKEGCQMISEN